MRETYLIGGAILAALVAPAVILLEPVMAGATVGAVAALWLVLGLPREKVGAFGLATAVTVAVAIPASEFSGSFRQALSAIAIAIMVPCYIRSDIRRPIHQAVWLAPLWLLILGLGEFAASDAAVKWAVFSGLVLMTILISARAEIRPVLRWVVILALVQVAVSAMQVLAGWELPWEQVTNISGNEILGPPWTRGPGTMGHPLPMVFLLVAACVVLLRDRQWMHPGARMLALVAMACGVVFAGSRSGALILVALVIFASARRLNFATWFFGGIAAVVGILLVVQSGFFTSQAFEKIMASGSVYHRQGAVEAFEKLFTLQGVKEVFLGSGYSGVPQAFDLGLLQSDGFNTVDNQFITLVVTSGLIGAAIFTGLLWAAFRAGDSAGRVLIVAVVSMFLIFDVLLWTSSTMLLMVALGFGLSRGKEPVTTPEQPQLEKAGSHNG